MVDSIQEKIMKSGINKLNITTMLKLMGIFVLGTSLLSGCAKPKPADDAQLSRQEHDGLMGTRYTEFLIVWGNPLKKDFVAGVYNTVGQNSPEGKVDSSPQEMLDKVDMDKAVKALDALSHVLNGPRLWTIDHLGVNAGTNRDFQGLKAHWVMWFPIPDEIREGKDLSYYVMDALRDTDMTIWKGSRVYILDDPDGNSFVMKSASLIKDPNQKFEDLKDLGSRLKLAEGWKFRSKVLDQELVFKTKDGKSFIVQDDKFYALCSSMAILTEFKAIIVDTVFPGQAVSEIVGDRQIRAATDA